MPPTAGHAMVTWGGNVLSIGGHTKVPDGQHAASTGMITQGGFPHAV
jgi:hypothetical protein